MCVVSKGPTEALKGHEVVVGRPGGGGVAVSTGVPVEEVGEVMCVVGACLKCV